MATSELTLRRGLPRTIGGEPWPVVAAAPVAESAAVVASDVAAEPALVASATPATAVPETSASAAATGATTAVVADGIRRGLPRVAGGAPWPGVSAAGLAAIAAAGLESAEAAVSRVTAESAAPAESPATAESPAPAESAAPAAPTPTAALQDPAANTLAAEPAQATAAPVPVAAAPVAQPAVVKAQAAVKAPAAAPGGTSEPAAAFSAKQKVGVAIVCLFAIFGLATAVVLAARWLIGLAPVADFVARYPGEYELPHAAPVGLPAWLGWQHFFNLFFMVLIVRTGLQVRHQTRPPAYWASKRNPQNKISIMLWLHQSLDVLWMVNGVVFVILLFSTGQWMRVVPTSWEVFPNALSAGLQYLTLNWPVENGWINYNSLQQLAYFLTIFVAAPLAVASGVRLSGFWPKNNAKLSAAYPIEVARLLHFPVMLYFVAFTIVHVTLVMTTGALRNLNHMYGARDEVSWYGALMLLISLVVIAGAFVAARPMVLAPIARMMGNVSAR